ncbi:MAG: OpgC domain-containing protein [Coriobacteriales bacterium]|nr:OpgC domain-containing protein [Coriobacteriales bacterium]
MQSAEQKRRTEFPLFVWIILFVIGALIEFAGRFFGWSANPSHIWHEWAPLAAVVLAVFICILGYFRFAKGNETQNSAKKWTGIGFAILGLSMLGISFLLRYSLIPVMTWLLG